jgi:hypothetical protein
MAIEHEDRLGTDLIVNSTTGATTGDFLAHGVPR